MKIHAVDISGRNQDLQDDSMVEKYEMSDEKYNERADSVRMWKKKMLADKETVGIKDTEENVTLAQTMKIGDRCEVRVKGQGSRRGVVAFIGNTQFKDGVWIGIKYDEPVGKNNGSVAGIKYFECDDKYGGFVRPSDVITGDFPELVLAEMDEI
uniref:CAP-Gly domain-containing protein n=1 Tax=Heterorhabditis bacteriophora TaxID=37862 RepID=A0A1I7XIF3_HETBA